MAPPAIKFTFKGQKKLQRTIKALAKRNQAAAVRAIATCGLNIQRVAKRKAPVDTGRLRADIRPFFSDSGLTVDVNTSVQYAPAVEFGTGPHQTSKGAALFQRSIARWAGRHGIPDEAVFAVMQKIREEGTKAQPFLKPAFDTEAPKCLRKIKDALKKASEKGRR